MNAQTRFERLTAPLAASFPTLLSCDIEEINGDIVTFTIANSGSFITAEVQAAQVKAYTYFGNNDPQNEIEVSFESLEIEQYCRPVVIDFDQVCCVAGLQFELTSYQVLRLNEEIKEHLEEKFREKLNQDADDAWQCRFDEMGA